jgi:hypothetical protein
MQRRKTRQVGERRKKGIPVIELERGKGLALVPYFPKEMFVSKPATPITGRRSANTAGQTEKKGEGKNMTKYKL